MVSSNTPQSPGAQLTQFMHFSVCSFDPFCIGNPLGYRLSDPSFFNPSALDADQWVRVAKSWGATEICLTARHASGFAIWQTNLTSYGVKESPWKGGKGDVVREFVDACRRGGVLPCLYYSIVGDVEQAVNVKNDTQAHINNLAMLEELLLNYGPFSRLWWDGFATSCSTPGNNANNTCRTNSHGAPSYDCRHPIEVLSPSCPAWYDFISLVNRVAPSTLMVPGPDGNLVNPEVLGGTYPLWHAVQPPYAVAPPPGQNSSRINGCYWQGNPGADQPGGDAFAVAESDFTLLYPPHTRWFWDGGPIALRAADIWEQYLLKTGQGAALILNIPPDHTGQINATFVAMMAEFGKALNDTYLAPIAALPAEVTSPTCGGLSITLPIPLGAAPFDQVVLSENFAPNGQVVAGFSLEVERAAQPGVWAPLPGNRAKGSTVGARVTALLGAPLSGASRLRLNCTASVDPEDATPVTIHTFSAFFAKPPQQAKALGA